jgi:hypothetical protein
MRKLKRLMSDAIEIIIDINLFDDFYNVQISTCDIVYDNPNLLILKCILNVNRSNCNLPIAIHAINAIGIRNISVSCM